MVLSPAISLSVVLEDGEVLVDTPFARREDFFAGIDLPGGRATRDLFHHYLAFIQGGAGPYRSEDWLSKTYVKFGAAIQDKVELTIEIRLAGQG